MRMIGLLPSLRTSRNPLVAFGLFALVIFAGYQAAELVLSGDMSGMMFVALIFAAGAVVIAILNDWRRGLYIPVAWVVFEDLFRKYLGNNMAIVFAKDFLAIILYQSFFVAHRKNRVAPFKPPFFKFFMFFFWFGLIQVFNPNSTSVFYGIMGIKIDFLYFPLIYIGYALIETEEDVRRFFSFNAALILVVVGLEIAQTILGQKFLNPSVLQEDIRELSNTYRIAPISGLIAYRPNSVFVSGGRLQDFLLISWLVSLGYGGYLLLRSTRGRTLAKSLKGTPWFPFGFAIFMYSAMLLLPMSYIGFITYQDFIVNAYFWLLLGILFRLQNFPKLIQLAASQQATSSAAGVG